MTYDSIHSLDDLDCTFPMISYSRDMEEGEGMGGEGVEGRGREERKGNECC